MRQRAVEEGRPRRRPALLFGLVLFGAFLFSLAPRVLQYREWIDPASGFVSQGVPVASTDSYYWFRLAEAARRGETAAMERDRLRSHPHGVAFSGVPALSRLMAALADALGTSVYRAGLLLMIPLSSLFLFPLGAYFYRAGVPLAGIWGGLVATFSSAYFGRTFVYRVDTDGGNMFFLWLVALGTFVLSPAASLRSNAIRAALAGLALQAFCAWYQQPGFALPIAACLVLHLGVSRFDARQVALLTGIFVLLANPANLVRGAGDLTDFLRHFVLAAGTEAPAGVVSVGGVAFPGVLVDIAELRRASLSDSFGSLLHPPLLGAAGIVAFLVFAGRHWRLLVPLLPMLALGVLGVLQSRRFLMFLAPFAGAGLGVALTRLIEIGDAAESRRAKRSAGGPSEARLYAVGLLAFVPVVFLTAIAGRPAPRVTADLIASLQALAPKLSEDAAVAHTWGNGYLVSHLTGAATFNDGELVDPAVEQLLSRGLVSEDPRVLHDVLGFLAAEGSRGASRILTESGSYSALSERVEAGTDPTAHPLYLLLTDKMAREFSSTWRKGRWDFASARGPREGYDIRSCRALPGGVLECERAGLGSLRVDPPGGTINGQPVLKKFLRVRRGQIVQEIDHPIGDGLYLQQIESAEGVPETLHVLKRPVFDSNFNQMFVLGRFDTTRFRNVHDDFPVARAYEVLPAGGKSGAALQK